MPAKKKTTRKPRAGTIVPARRAITVRPKRVYKPVRMINNPRGHVMRYAQNIPVY